MKAKFFVPHESEANHPVSAYITTYANSIDCFHSRDHKLSNRRHAAILVDKQTESRFTVKMVFCMMVVEAKALEINIFISLEFHQ